MKKIIFNGQTKQGQQYIIRYPKSNDAPALRDYINCVSKEQTFILLQGEQLTLKEEKNYLAEQLKKIAKREAILLCVIVAEKIVGVSGLKMKDKVEKHVGVFGISLAREFRGQGIGKKLMQLVLSEAKKNIPLLRIITLEVFKNNSLAMKMYKKFGFRKYGQLPKGISHQGKRVDHVFMYKNVKE